MKYESLRLKEGLVLLLIGTLLGILGTLLLISILSASLLSNIIVGGIVLFVIILSVIRFIRQRKTVFRKGGIVNK